MPDMDSQLVIPASGMESNPGLPEALRETSLDPRMVNHVDEIMLAMLNMESYVRPSYIGANATLPTVIVKDEKWDFADAAPGNVYYQVSLR